MLNKLEHLHSFKKGVFASHYCYSKTICKRMTKILSPSTKESDFFSISGLFGSYLPNKPVIQKKDKGHCLCDQSKIMFEIHEIIMRDKNIYPI